VFASGVRAYVTAWRAWWSGGEGGGGRGSGSAGAGGGGGGGGEESAGAEERKGGGEEAPPPRLHTAWLAASSAGVRSGKEARRANSRSSRAEAAPRALHAAAFEISAAEEEQGEEGEGTTKRKEGVVAVLVATSLGAVEAVAFDSRSGGFSDSDPVRLEFHEGPALCVSHLRAPGGDPFLKNGLAFSGSTDGGVAVWSGAEIARALLSDSSSPAPASSTVSPLAVLPALHQSGVNCLAVATAAAAASSSKRGSSSRSVLLVTGGDDGALRATLLCVSSPSPSADGSRPVVSVAASATLEGAHSACALRGAWVGEIEGLQGGGKTEAEVVTVGLDQRLRGWSVSIESDEREPSSLSVSLVALWSVPVQVPAPESLAVLPEWGLVSVSGRGTQAFSWK
jgi:hypothetical protein